MSAFSIFKDKRKQAKKQQTPTAEAYYQKLANRAKIGMFAVIIALVAFCLFSYSFYPEELTIENFRYLLKFISFEQNEEIDIGTEIAFDTDKTNRYTMVRGDIAVLSKTQLAVYDTSGQLLQRAPLKNDTPMLLTAGKNMIIYDLGGKELNVYNSFSPVYTEDFGYPILGISASENGSYAVLSGAKNYRSAVYVYDSNYRLVFSHYFPTEYSTALQLDNNGKKVLVLSHIAENGDYLGSAALFDTGTEEPIANFKFAGELPLSCHFTSDGGYIILTDKYIRFYDKDNNEIAEQKLGYGLLGCTYGENYVSLTFDTAGLAESKTFKVYGADGKEIYSTSLESSPDDILIQGDRLYMLSMGALTVYDLQSNEMLFNITVDNEAVDMIISEDKLLVFTYSGVTVYGTDTLTETELEEDKSSLTEGK